MSLLSFIKSKMSIILCILMFLIIVFRKRFRNVTLVPSLKFLVKNTYLKLDLGIYFFGNVFPKIILKLLLLGNKLSKYNLVMNFQS
jgi:hypothetical protein